MKTSKLFLLLGLVSFPLIVNAQNSPKIKRGMTFRHTDFQKYTINMSLDKNSNFTFYYDTNGDGKADLAAYFESSPIYTPFGKRLKMENIASSVFLNDKGGKYTEIGFYNFDESEDGSLETKMVFNEKGEIIKRIPEEKAEPKREKGKYFANSSNFHA